MVIILIELYITRPICHMLTYVGYRPTYRPIGVRGGWKRGGGVIASSLTISIMTISQNCDNKAKIVPSPQCLLLGKDCALPTMLVVRQRLCPPHNACC